MRWNWMTTWIGKASHKSFEHTTVLIVCSIEELATSLSYSLNVSALRKSIADVQAASRTLDIEKADAEKTFKELLDKLPKTGPVHSIISWIKWLLGLHKFPIHKFIKAAKRVQEANTKLAGFEKGFISKEGIKDRAWYKHLGVAPGKWSGESGVRFHMSWCSVLTRPYRARCNDAAVDIRRVGGRQERDGCCARGRACVGDAGQACFNTPMSSFTTLVWVWRNRRTESKDRSF